MRKWHRTLLAVALVVTFYTTMVFAATGVKTFPTGKDIPTTVDPADPYSMTLTGLYEQKLTVNGTERTIKVYIPEDARHCDYPIYIAVPSGEDTVNFLKSSGWMTIADKYQTYLAAFEPANQKWDISKPENELAYIKAADVLTSNRSVYNFYTSNHYFVGYGDGGQLLQQYIMSNPNNCAGLAVFDGSNIDESYLKTTGAKPSSDPNKTLSQIEAPVLLINESITPNVQKVIDYWMKANDCETQAYETDFSTVYLQSMARNTVTLENQPVSSVQLITRKPNYKDVAFNKKVWVEFLSKTGRYSGILSTNLRPIATPDQLGLKEVKLAVDGKDRYWYEYVPSYANVHPEAKLPLVVAFHGYTQRGDIVAYYTEWYKEAEDNNFIVLFPSAYPLYNVFNNNEFPKPSFDFNHAITGFDEVSFIKKMVENVKSRYNINSGKVYATGHSNGSAITFRCAVDLPDIFTAVGSTGLNMVGISKGTFFFPADIKTDYEVPVFLSVGQFDIGGGSFTTNVDAKATMDYWIKRNNAGSVETPKTYKSGLFNSQVWFNAANIPMARYVYIQYKGHLSTPADAKMMWEEWFCKYTRDTNGNILYMQDKIFE